MFDKHVTQYRPAEEHGYDYYNAGGRKYTKASYDNIDGADLLLLTPEFVCRRVCYWSGICRHGVFGERRLAGCPDAPLWEGGYVPTSFGFTDSSNAAEATKDAEGAEDELADVSATAEDEVGQIESSDGESEHTEGE